MRSGTSKKLLLAAPRGFCAGVDMAIACLDRALELYGPPIYVYHQIVHNKFLVGRFQGQGAIFVDFLEEVPPGSRLLFSAHGVAPQIRQEAAARNLMTIDATCPLVTKVHEEAKRFANDGRTLFFIGHSHHDEAVGVIGEAPDQIVTITSIDDIHSLPRTIDREARTAYLTQTTLAVDETQRMIDALRERFPNIQGPRQSDICYATQNRQRAVQVLAEEADVTIVIGSWNSSNSQRLVDVASAQGKPAYLVDGWQEINLDWFEGVSTILLTAGASVPEEIVHEAVAWLCQRVDLEVDERILEEETVHFQLPVEFRRELNERSPELLQPRNQTIPKVFGFTSDETLATGPSVLRNIMNENNQTHEITVVNLPVDQQESQQTTRLIQGILRLGIGLISAPLVLLPAESRKHMEAAAREFTNGAVALVREIASSLERIAQDVRK